MQRNSFETTQASTLNDNLQQVPAIAKLCLNNDYASRSCRKGAFSMPRGELAVKNPI